MEKIIHVKKVFVTHRDGFDLYDQVKAEVEKEEGEVVVNFVRSAFIASPALKAFFSQVFKFGINFKILCSRNQRIVAEERRKMKRGIQSIEWEMLKQKGT